MVADNLKNALQQAGMTPEEFADIVRVDPKTVQRWVAGTSTPYPRHRATIALALNLTAHDLWPDTVPAAGSVSGDGHASSGEVTGTWAYTTDPNCPDPVALISSSDCPIDILDNGRGIELTDSLLTTVLQQADTGRQVRLLTCLPEQSLTPLIGRDQIGIRVIDGGIGYSLIRAGNTILLTFNLADEGDQPPPILKLQRTDEDGLFTRLVGNFETLWNDAGEALTDPEQLDEYLTNSDGDISEEQELAVPEPGGLNARVVEQPAHSAGAPVRTATDSEPPQRHWPRRVD
jgi:hypothetical protein